MKLRDLFESSIGQQTVDYADWIDSHKPKISKQEVAQYLQFGETLLKDGWTFKTNGGEGYSPWFIKMPWAITLPRRDLPKAMKSLLMIGYFLPNQKIPRSGDYTYLSSAMEDLPKCLADAKDAAEKLQKQFG